MPSKRRESDPESDDLDTLEDLQLTYHRSNNKHFAQSVQQPGPRRKVRSVLLFPDYDAPPSCCASLPDLPFPN